MNAMLEPRIVAASTQGRTFSAQTAAPDPACITASSHGCLMTVWMRTDGKRFRMIDKLDVLRSRREMCCETAFPMQGLVAELKLQVPPGKKLERITRYKPRLSMYLLARRNQPVSAL